MRATRSEARHPLAARHVRLAALRGVDGGDATTPARPQGRSARTSVQATPTQPSSGVGDAPGGTRVLNVTTAPTPDRTGGEIVRERPPVPAGDMNPGQAFGDSIPPSGYRADRRPGGHRHRRPIPRSGRLTRSATPSGALPRQSPRRLADLPDGQCRSLRPEWRGCTPRWRRTRPRAAVRTRAVRPVYSPDTPADPEFFNIAQIVVKFVEGASVRLDGEKLVVTREVKEPANLDRLSRAGIELPTLRRQVAAFNPLVADQRGGRRPRRAAG